MNLICPARLILLVPGSRAFLAGERIAEVYATPDAEEPAAGLAAELGVRLTLLQPPPTALAPLPTAAPAAPAESVVRDIADLHRGETVVLVAPGLDLGLELPVMIEHEGDNWYVVPGVDEV
ncbi:hypothetical protein [Kribbella sp. CA-293567]|uniref:hypothetical protein n=1 Tax=Kribbella sp. CA-293567 TaxID=3002436 RepID=UPI0022DE54D1|nr:hypothetical protein [Kribbella sp. CA-293567]WBQ07444.1 hypothetical protein OX958_11720 [Kribbella sp. CA-293567]